MQPVLLQKKELLALFLHSFQYEFTLKTLCIKC